MRAITVFHDKGAGFWPRLFGRPGFRHCFVALNDGRAWLIVDPISRGTEVSADVAADYDLVAFYRSQGFTVLDCVITPQARPYPVWFFTCVEAVKRVLGLRGWWIWTPYQLYKHLEKAHGHHRDAGQTQGRREAEDPCRFQPPARPGRRQGRSPAGQF